MTYEYVFELANKKTYDKNYKNKPLDERMMSLAILKVLAGNFEFITSKDNSREMIKNLSYDEMEKSILINLLRYADNRVFLKKELSHLEKSTIQECLIGLDNLKLISEKIFNGLKILNSEIDNAVKKSKLDSGRLDSEFVIKSLNDSKKNRVATEIELSGAKLIESLVMIYVSSNIKGDITSKSDSPFNNSYYKNIADNIEKNYKSSYK